MHAQPCPIGAGSPYGVLGRRRGHSSLAGGASNWFTQALGKAMMLLDDRPGLESLMVLPDYPRYRDLAARTRTGRRAAGIHVLLLDAQGGFMSETWTP
ncbi:hypothetical protein GCM10010199_53190 [Dactylosporangium roseum]